MNSFDIYNELNFDFLLDDKDFLQYTSIMSLEDETSIAVIIPARSMPPFAPYAYGPSSFSIPTLPFVEDSRDSKQPTPLPAYLSKRPSSSQSSPPQYESRSPSYTTIASSTTRSIPSPVVEFGHERIVRTYVARRGLNMFSWFKPKLGIACHAALIVETETGKTVMLDRMNQKRMNFSEISIEPIHSTHFFPTDTKKRNIEVFRDSKDQIWEKQTTGDIPTVSRTITEIYEFTLQYCAENPYCAHSTNCHHFQEAVKGHLGLEPPKDCIFTKISKWGAPFVVPVVLEARDGVLAGRQKIGGVLGKGGSRVKLDK